MARILVADRDSAIAALLEAALGRLAGIEVRTVFDAATAEAVLQKQPFDLMLLDIGMYSDGLETLEHVDGHNEGCEVIALTTGVVQAPLLKTLAAADVFAVITKPFDLNQLVAIVTECLRGDGRGEANQPRVYRVAGDEPTLD